MPPACSVIIPTYNRAELLRRTLDSLVRQDLPTAEFEVLVVDDGSSRPHRRGGCASYADRLDAAVLLPAGRGLAGGAGPQRRAGRRRRRGVRDGRLRGAAALGLPARAPGQPPAGRGAGGGGRLRLRLRHRRRRGGRDDRHLGRSGRCRLRRPGRRRRASCARTGRWADVRELFYAKYADDFAGLPAPWIVYWTCNVSAPTDRLRAVGGFDEQIRSWGGEDLDLGYRLHLDGVAFALNRAACSIHYPHGSSLAERMVGARAIHRYVAGKHGTPVMRMLPMLGGALNFLTFNDVVRARKLPECREFLRQQAAAHQTAHQTAHSPPTRPATSPRSRPPSGPRGSGGVFPQSPGGGGFRRYAGGCQRPAPPATIRSPPEVARPGRSTERNRRS